MCDFEHKDECQHAAQAERERIIKPLEAQIARHNENIVYHLPKHCDDCVFAMRVIALIKGETE